MITEEGREEVKRAHKYATERVSHYELLAKTARERVFDLERAVNCDHPEDRLVHGGAIFMETTCNKCGYTWFEFNSTSNY